MSDENESYFKMIIKFPFSSWKHFFGTAILIISIISLILFFLKDDPINCEGSWSKWSNCSAECGGGTQTRTYNIKTQPQYGGTPCPELQGSQGSQPCNTEACAICSSFQCPRNYSSRTDAADVSCGKTRCDNSNIDLCCENIQVDNDATEDAARGVDAGIVDVQNATCSTVSGNCPDGYLYKTHSSERECNGPTCDVGIGGVDLNTCCEQGCSAPSSLPSGYAGSLPATLPVGVGDITGVQCATNYHGTPTYNCATAGVDYTIVAGGCEPDTCTTPDTTGYNITSVTSLEKHNFNVNVSCEAGYGPIESGASAGASQCSNHNSPYSLTGCEHKIGFCSGNYDSSNDVSCPTGYNDKPDKNTTVNRIITDCCEPWICGISDDDFALYDIQVNDIQANRVSIDRKHMSYSTIDSATVSCKAGAQRTSGSVIPSIQSCSNDGGNVTLNGCEHSPVDCAVDWSEWSDCSAECGGGTQTRTYNITTQPAHGGTPCPTSPESRDCNTEACATCSSYQCPTGYNLKTNSDNIVGNTLETCCDQIIPPPEAQTSGTQDTDLPICSQVAVPNKIADMALTETHAGNLQNCSDLCASLPTCQSFAYSDIDPGHDPRMATSSYHNCIISELIETIDPYGEFINEGYLSWSFYPKCRISQSEAQTPGTQDTDLPICNDIKLTGVKPTINPIVSFRANNVRRCEDYCFDGRGEDTCNSFAFNNYPGNYRCYIYANENLTTVNNQNFNYYPVKCQP